MDEIDIRGMYGTRRFLFYFFWLLFAHQEATFGLGLNSKWFYTMEHTLARLHNNARR